MPITREGRSLGSYGTQGNGILTFHWAPSPLEFQNKILDVKDSLQDRSAPLRISEQFIQDDIAENFAGEHDPEGQPWVEWSGSYADQVVPFLKPPHTGKKLDWRSILREAATDESAFRVVSGKSTADDSLFFDPSGLPPYWGVHQYGATISTADGKSAELPKRPYLGISDDIEIMEIFDTWFQGIITMAVSSKGRVFGRHSKRGAGGRFVKK